MLAVPFTLDLTFVTNSYASLIPDPFHASGRGHLVHPIITSSRWWDNFIERHYGRASTLTSPPAPQAGPVGFVQQAILVHTPQGRSLPGGAP